VERALQSHNGGDRGNLDGGDDAGRVNLYLLGTNKTFLSGIKAVIFRYLHIPILAIELIFFLTVGALAANQAEKAGQQKAEIQILTHMSIRGLSEVNI